MKEITEGKSKKRKIRKATDEEREKKTLKSLFMSLLSY